MFDLEAESFRQQLLWMPNQVCGIQQPQAEGQSLSQFTHQLHDQDGIALPRS